MTRTRSRRSTFWVKEVCGPENKDLVRRAADLVLAVCPDDYREPCELRWQMAWAPGSRLFCAFTGDQLVGVGSFARVQWTKGQEVREGPKLDALAVLPAHQGLQVGSRILRNMIRAAADDAAIHSRQERLFVFGPDFERNPRFFEAQGAVVDPASAAQEQPDLYVLPAPRSLRSRPLPAGAALAG